MNDFISYRGENYELPSSAAASVGIDNLLDKIEIAAHDWKTGWDIDGHEPMKFYGFPAFERRFATALARYDKRWVALAINLAFGKEMTVDWQWLWDYLEYEDGDTAPIQTLSAEALMEKITDTLAEMREGQYEKEVGPEPPKEVTRERYMRARQSLQAKVRRRQKVGEIDFEIPAIPKKITEGSIRNLLKAAQRFESQYGYISAGRWRGMGR